MTYSGFKQATQLLGLILLAAVALRADEKRIFTNKSSANFVIKLTEIDPPRPEKANMWFRLNAKGPAIPLGDKSKPGDEISLPAGSFLEVEFTHTWKAFCHTFKFVNQTTKEEITFTSIYDWPFVKPDRPAVDLKFRSSSKMPMSVGFFKGSNIGDLLLMDVKPGYVPDADADPNASDEDAPAASKPVKPPANADYELLGLDPKKAYTQKELTSTYRKLAKEWHPDKNPGKEAEAGEKFKGIYNAYERIRDFYKANNKE